MRPISKFAIVFAAALACAASLVRAQDDGPVIAGDELRRILAGNTVWVLRQDFTAGDEYHLPDGRVYGFNGYETIENGCWDIVGNQVCYYYKDDYAKGRAHCWTFRRTGPDRFLLADSRGYRGYGRKEIGNPRNYSNNGKPWECRRLMSQREAKRMSSRTPEAIRDRFATGARFPADRGSRRAWPG